MIYINELHDGDTNETEEYLVTSVNKCVSNNGKPYLNITFQDKTGTIDGKKWDIDAEDVNTFAVGNIVSITFDVLDYKDKLQLKVLSGNAVDPRFVTLENFVMSSPIPKENLEKRYKEILASFKDPNVIKLVNYIDAKYHNEIITYPAAVRNHHAFSSGLLYHTISMADVAISLYKHYKDLDYDLLMAGVLFHDLGKISELSGPIITKFTLPGNLLGHIVLGENIVHDAAVELGIDKEEKILLIEHEILASHGHYEFGSPSLPITKEALLLSYIDDLDAKMTMLDKAYSEIEDGEFTPRIMPLDNRSFYKKNK